MSNVKDFKGREPVAERQVCPDCQCSFWQWFMVRIGGEWFAEMVCPDCVWSDCEEGEE